MNPGDDRRLKLPDGTESHYWICEPSENRAPAFLFIHGLGSNRTRWKRLAMEPFFSRFRLVIPDLRGHGASLARRGIDADGFSADLEAIMNREGIERPVVVGHCLGANIAMRLWERSPRNIAGLVLIEPFVTEVLEGTWKRLHAVLGPVVACLEWLVWGLNRIGFQRKRFRRIDYSVYDDWVRPRLTSLFGVIRWMGPWADLQCMPAASYLASYRVLFRYRPPWQKLNVPALALMARQGGVLSHDVGRHPLNRPGVRIVLIEASHFVLTDNREEVARRTQSFIEELRGNGLWKN